MVFGPVSERFGICFGKLRADFCPVLDRCWPGVEDTRPEGRIYCPTHATARVKIVFGRCTNPTVLTVEINLNHPPNPDRNRAKTVDVRKKMAVRTLPQERAPDGRPSIGTP